MRASHKLQVKPESTASPPPVASVVIPAYRASADIRAALASVFAQSFSAFEVIVVNDGSPDTVELEAALTPFRDRLQYVAQANRGAAAARNEGIRLSRGRYIAFLDADDLWAPEFLRRQIDYLEANPACALVYADAMITGDTDLVGRRFMQQAPSKGPVTLVSLIQQRCNVLLSTVVARRAPLVDVGLFDESLRRGHDFDLWLRLALHGCGIAYQQLVLGERRARADGLSGSSRSELERALHVLDRFGRHHDLPWAAYMAWRLRVRRLRDALEIEQGKLQMLEGNYAAARHHLEASSERALKVRVALMGLRWAPRLLRRAYVALHSSARQRCVRQPGSNSWSQ